MTFFEQYLFSIGYKPYKKVYEKKQWSYVELKIEDVSKFSTMESGRIDNRWVLNNDFDKEIIFGLHERNKPPTLIYPRPKNIDDDEMNILLKTTSPKEVYNLILC